MKKSLSTGTEKHGRWLPWAAGTLAFAGLAGTLFALSEILESDSDNDGWTDAEEIIAGTNPADETDPWDSDGDGIADYLEFADGTDPLDPNDPPQARGASAAYGVAATTNETTEGGDKVGSLVWTCPIRWSIANPGKKEGENNSDLHYDGRLQNRIQTTSVYLLEEEGENPTLQVIVDKLFF